VPAGERRNRQKAQRQTIWIKAQVTRADERAQVRRTAMLFVGFERDKLEPTGAIGALGRLFEVAAMGTYTF